MNLKRLRKLNDIEYSAGSVVYWMSRDQRVQDNWAFIFAYQFALERQLPLSIIFVLADNYPNANNRNLGFMLEGLSEVTTKTAEINIPLVLLRGNPKVEICKYIESNQVGLLVADFDPLKVKTKWKKEVAGKINIPFVEVDAHNIVPTFYASTKQEFGAYTIRPKINKLLGEFLEDFPGIEYYPYNNSEIISENSIEATLNSLDKSNHPNRMLIKSGSKNAEIQLQNFIKFKLKYYAELRNYPNLDYQSNLSPYLHFGQISAQRIALEVMSYDEQSDSTASFLEELIIRRELSDNFCLYNDNYDNFAGFPDWARKTLDEHRLDKREYLYTLDQLENADTHDIYWNASQIEMLSTGKMHGYMRMYWCKKILEWTESPEQAIEFAIYLNDKYQLDGRDPNGYAGVAWSIGGVHDRAWGERAIFGKIRYMNDKGLVRKFDMKPYLERFSNLLLF